jgi:hypothetical protein
MDDLSIHPLTPERLEDYLRFFDTQAFTDNPRWASCYCYYDLADPRQRKWEERSGEENRAAVSDRICRERMHGYLAYTVGCSPFAPGT